MPQISDPALLSRSRFAVGAIIGLVMVAFFGRPRDVARPVAKSARLISSCFSGERRSALVPVDDKADLDTSPALSIPILTPEEAAENRATARAVLTRNGSVEVADASASSGIGHQNGHFLAAREFSIKSERRNLKNKKDL